ncbi:hypothetical protein VN97_g9787 [Penicillium thymicola]|uniref:Peptidase C14 caspase domain-containing protein n=1 Tax=Penicillium thymicola TaxID=293382 RepID=A0AAI9X4Q2_PENTH|nr:hypothetical protein VN97_g9787 [Penicillium thymicola]
MSLNSLLLNHPISRESIELDRLVLDPKYPDQDFCQSSFPADPCDQSLDATNPITPPFIPDVATQQVEKSHEVLQHTRGTPLELSLLKLIYRPDLYMDQVDSVPEKWAVLIGVEYYEHPEQPTTTPRHDGRCNKIEYRTLLGCVNDVLAAEQYLVDTINVNPRHITKLLAPCPGRKYLSQLPVDSYRDASYDNMVDALKVPEGAKKGDFVYIHFSGHGARATTVFPELKDGGADAVDEALVPSDITRGGNYLRDLEMGFLLQAMVDTGLVVTVVLDCCHSGGAIRGDDDPELGETRGILNIYKSDPKLDLPRTIDSIVHFGRQPSWMQAPQGFVVLAACQELETAKETTDKDYTHGILTYWLLKILRNSLVDISSQALYERICANVQDNSRNQTPYLVGDKDRFFFSKKLRSRVYALAVREVNVEPYKAPIDRSVYLSGGKHHGVEEESEYAILPWGFDLGKRIKDTDILGRVQVKKVMPAKSLALFTLPCEVRWDGIVDGCPAVLQKLPIAKKSTVHFITPDENQRDNFKKNWDKLDGDRTWLKLDEEDNSSPFFTISIDDSGNFKIRGRSGNLTAAIENALKPLPAANADSIRAVIRRLEHLARFIITRELANPDVRPEKPSSLVTIKVDSVPEGQSVSGQWFPPAEIGERVPGVYEVPEKTMFRIAINNQSDRPLGCVVLDCGAEFGIEHVFPQGRPYHTLKPGDHEDALFWMEIASEMRLSAQGGIPIVDTLKVFVFDPPTNIDSLRLQGLMEMEDGRRGGDGEMWSQDLEDLLNFLNTSRLAKSLPARGALKADWETFSVKIRIKPSSE